MPTQLSRQRSYALVELSPNVDGDGSHGRSTLESVVLGRQRLHPFASVPLGKGSVVVQYQLGTNFVTAGLYEQPDARFSRGRVGH